IEQSLSLLINDDRFRHRGGFDLHELGKARTIVHEMQTVAIDPAMIAAFAPGAVGIEMAELLRDASGLAIGLMPHRALGFEQTFVRVEIFRGKAGIEVFRIGAQKGDEVLQDVIEGFIAPRQGGTIRHAVEAKDRSHLGMLHQPTALGFEAKETTLVNEQEEHDQSLMLIEKGMPSVGTG